MRKAEGGRNVKKSPTVKWGIKDRLLCIFMIIGKIGVRNMPCELSECQASDFNLYY